MSDDRDHPNMSDTPRFSLVYHWGDDLFPAVEGYVVFEHGKEISAFFCEKEDAEWYIKVRSIAPSALEVADRLRAIVDDGWSPTDEVDDAITEAVYMLRDLFQEYR